MKPTDVKQILDDILREVVSAPTPYVYEPQKKFHVHASYLSLPLLKC